MFFLQNYPKFFYLKPYANIFLLNSMQAEYFFVIFGRNIRLFVVQS